MDDVLDRIERQIDISATAERVWELISRPGWYINDGAVIEHRIDRSGDLDVVHDPVHGSFPIRTVRLDPPRYAAYRWASTTAGTSPDGDSSTLVEFWIEDNAAGGVTLRVVESGFSALAVSADERRRSFDGNTEGWRIELAAAKSFVECAADPIPSSVADQGNP